MFPWILRKLPAFLNVCGVKVKGCRLLLLLLFVIKLSVVSTATVRVTVDGGTNRWLTWLTERGYDLKNIKPPHLVTGDMDSISKHLLQYYMNSNQTTQVLHTPDQYETDYTKAVRETQQFLSDRNLVVCSIVFPYTCHLIRHE